MSYNTAYQNALLLMSKGAIYWIDSMGMGWVALGHNAGQKVNMSIMQNAFDRGHIKIKECTSLAWEYELTDAGKQALIKILEARAFPQETEKKG